MVKDYDYRHTQQRKAVLERDEYVCHWCGGEATEADHVGVPVVLGGAHGSIDDLVASCKPCNARRGAKLGNELRKRAQRHPFFEVTS